MIRRVIESFVDLTYRGLSLGRRIRLSQVRPTSGYLELAAPMPVGAVIAIAADDGIGFEATVTWVHEQVGGTDRTPGMIVAPALAGERDQAWWKERVTIADDEAARRRSITGSGRSRPPTVRPRSHTDPMPQRGADAPAIKADLDARVTAAAGVATAPRAQDIHEAPTAILPALALSPRDLAAHDRVDLRTIVMPAAELAALQAQSSDGEPDPATTLQMAQAEHEVVDDGSRTTIMDTMDPATLAALGLGGDGGGAHGATAPADGASGAADGAHGALGSAAAAGRGGVDDLAALGAARGGDDDDDYDVEVTDPGGIPVPDDDGDDDGDDGGDDGGDGDEGDRGDAGGASGPGALPDTLKDPPTAPPSGRRRKRRLRR
jgi:hypothetical protein